MSDPDWGAPPMMIAPLWRPPPPPARDAEDQFEDADREEEEEGEDTAPWGVSSLQTVVAAPAAARPVPRLALDAMTAASRPLGTAGARADTAEGEKGQTGEAAHKTPVTSVGRGAAPADHADGVAAAAGQLSCLRLGDAAGTREAARLVAHPGSSGRQTSPLPSDEPSPRSALDSSSVSLRGYMNSADLTGDATDSETLDHLLTPDAESPRTVRESVSARGSSAPSEGTLTSVGVYAGEEGDRLWEEELGRRDAALEGDEPEDWDLECLSSARGGQANSWHGASENNVTTSTCEPAGLDEPVKGMSGDAMVQLDGDMPRSLPIAGVQRSVVAIGSVALLVERCRGGTVTSFIPNGRDGSVAAAPASDASMQTMTSARESGRSEVDVAPPLSRSGTEASVIDSGRGGTVTSLNSSAANTVPSADDSGMVVGDDSPRNGGRYSKTTTEPNDGKSTGISPLSTEKTSAASLSDRPSAPSWPSRPHISSSDPSDAAAAAGAGPFSDFDGVWAPLEEAVSAAAAAGDQSTSADCQPAVSPARRRAFKRTPARKLSFTLDNPSPLLVEYYLKHPEERLQVLEDAAAMVGGSPAPAPPPRQKSAPHLRTPEYTHRQTPTAESRTPPAAVQRPLGRAASAERSPSDGSGRQTERSPSDGSGRPVERSPSDGSGRREERSPSDGSGRPAGRPRSDSAGPAERQRRRWRDDGASAAELRAALAARRDSEDAAGAAAREEEAGLTSPDRRQQEQGGMARRQYIALPGPVDVPLGWGSVLCSLAGREAAASEPQEAETEPPPPPARPVPSRPGRWRHSAPPPPATLELSPRPPTGSPSGRRHRLRSSPRGRRLPPALSPVTLPRRPTPNFDSHAIQEIVLGRSAEPVWRTPSPPGQERVPAARRPAAADVSPGPAPAPVRRPPEDVDIASLPALEELRLLLAQHERQLTALVEQQRRQRRQLETSLRRREEALLSRLRRQLAAAELLTAGQDRTEDSGGEEPPPPHSHKEASPTPYERYDSLLTTPPRRGDRRPARPAPSSPYADRPPRSSDQREDRPPRSSDQREDRPPRSSDQRQDRPQRSSDQREDRPQRSSDQREERGAIRPVTPADSVPTPVARRLASPPPPQHRSLVPPEALQPEMRTRYAKVTAAARGYLTRRLMRTEKVQSLLATAKESMMCAMRLQREVDMTKQITKQDVELHERLINQVRGACYSLHQLLIASTVGQRMAVIAADRAARAHAADRRRAAEPAAHLSRATLLALERKRHRDSVAAAPGGGGGRPGTASPRLRSRLTLGSPKSRPATAGSPKSRPATAGSPKVRGSPGGRPRRVTAHSPRAASRTSLLSERSVITSGRTSRTARSLVQLATIYAPGPVRRVKSSQSQLGAGQSQAAEPKRRQRVPRAWR